MRIFIVGIALLFLACGQGPSPSTYLPASLGEQVPLLTGRNTTLDVGCYTYYRTGVLLMDKTYGTSMAASEGGPVQPIMWPIGYTGYRVGSEIAVVDEFGHVVGITGQRYLITMGAANNDVVEPKVPNTFLSCGPPLPEPSGASPT